MNWFKKLLASKISITIVVPPPEGVTPTKTPRVIEESIVKRQDASNFRFVEDKEVSHTGEEKIWFYTQYRDKSGWRMVSNSLSHSKEKAMKLHLYVVEHGSLEPEIIKTVLWEGLSKEETKTWVEVQM